MGTSRVRLLCASGVFTLAVTLASAAFAQEQPPVSSTATPPADPAPAPPQDDKYSGPQYREDIIVTAQKRSESMQNVPISMSAFSAKDLDAQKVEGGFDLMKAVPNLTFSKSNFSSYNLSIRGIGTKAVSAASDPGVAVSFNSTALIHNRLFEQEYFDVERVEVLRGPQGTLYGRNATGGVVNLISAKPKLDKFEGSLKGEVGNYATKRLVGMLNIPIIDGKFGLRFAGSMTKRDGYDFNTITNNPVNGRDLWSGRVTARFEPAPWFRANFIWERFRESDDRSRTGKQLCHHDDGKTMVGSTPVVDDGTAFGNPLFVSSLFSTGCKAGSLYDDGAYGTPNGLALPSVYTLVWQNVIFPLGADANGQQVGLLNVQDPYRGMMQSRNLREIASYLDPIYRAKADVFEFNVDIDLTPGLTFTSQTAYNKDSVYSFQDFNRFNTAPIFNDTSTIVFDNGIDPGGYRSLAPGGVFCDPQIGCSNTLAGFDISSSDSRQFSQEIRLQSSFKDSPINFSVGANYTHFKTQDEYYIMSNVLTALALSVPLNQTGNIKTCAYTDFMLIGGATSVPILNSLCPYVDPNPYNKINGQGHNYFRNSNPYKLESYAAFGEVYWNIDSALKLTAGLRYTHDAKTSTLVPSQLLLSPTLVGGGITGTGYPSAGDLKLQWGEFTGRFGLDWKPHLGFTDQTLVYGFYSRGYKGGGANPPSPGYATPQQLVAAGIVDQSLVDALPQAFPGLALTGVNYTSTFKPEFVNAFEVGTKNTLFGGRLTINADAFFYDYKDYQISEIRDRTAVNENFDATIWGAELQMDFAVTRRLRLNANVGFLQTRIANGQKSIDTMNRNLGDPNYTVIKPWAQLPSNCVVPTPVAESYLKSTSSVLYSAICGGVGGLLGLLGQTPPIDPATGIPYDKNNYPELNGGAGLYTDLSGNELPNSPHWTVNVGAQYTIPFSEKWSATIRGDGYWQDQSFARVYNLLPYDRLRGWTNFNLTLRIEGPDGLAIEGYIKNLLNSTPITDAFLNSDDAGLTTNVFTLDPRIIGFSISKKF